MFTTKSFEHGGRVYIDRRHNSLFNREDSAQRFPTLIDLFDGRHVGHGATGCHVGQDYCLFGAAQDVGSLGHKMHAAKDDIRPLRPLGCQFREQERIPTKIRMFNDFISLIIMAEYHDAIAQYTFCLNRPAEYFLWQLAAGSP